MIELISKYQIILLPLISMVLVQIIKVINKSNNQKFDLRTLLSYSGMPSGHSAMVISLASIIGLVEGWDSSIFAISFILAIIVIRDALGIRQYLGEHGRILNILVKDLANDKVLEEHYPHLLEKIGHTPIQVVAGAALGLAVSVFGFLILN